MKRVFQSAKKISTKVRVEDDELARLSFLQSRCDPTQMYYKFDSFVELSKKQNDVIFNRTFIDLDDELAWRHAIYDPPTIDRRLPLVDRRLPLVDRKLPLVEETTKTKN